MMDEHTFEGIEVNANKKHNKLWWSNNIIDFKNSS